MFLHILIKRFILSKRLYFRMSLSLLLSLIWSGTSGDLDGGGTGGDSGGGGTGGDSGGGGTDGDSGGGGTCDGSGVFTPVIRMPNLH